MISIIVPVYNVEKYLKRCLNSIEQQTYDDWECIIVNDGSTDLSGEICKEYVNRDKRFHLINQENKGLSGARNTGLEVAKGEYICFVDSDDWIDIHYLDVLVCSLEKSNSDISICGYYESNGESHTARYLEVDCLCMNGKEFTDYVSCNKIQSFAWNKMYRKEVIKDRRYREGVYYEDVLMLNDIMPKISNVSVINKPLYYYYMRDDSIIHNRNIKRENDYFNAFKERYQLDYIQEKARYEILRLLMVEYYYILQVFPSRIKRKNEYYMFICQQGVSKIVKALLKMTCVEKVRFCFAFCFPNIYRFLTDHVKGAEYEK